MVQPPSFRGLPRICCSEIQLGRRTGAGIARAWASAAQPANLLPSGTTFSWKTVIGVAPSFIGRKSFVLVENNCIGSCIVENHYSGRSSRNPLINVENPLYNHYLVECHDREGRLVRGKSRRVSSLPYSTPPC